MCGTCSLICHFCAVTLSSELRLNKDGLGGRKEVGPERKERGSGRRREEEGKRDGAKEEEEENGRGREEGGEDGRGRRKKIFDIMGSHENTTKSDMISWKHWPRPEHEMT